MQFQPILAAFARVSVKITQNPQKNSWWKHLPCPGIRRAQFADDHHLRRSPASVVIPVALTLPLSAITSSAQAIDAAHAALEGTSADTVLAGLPGLLIATMALIFAVRERSRNRKLVRKLSEIDQQHPSNDQPTAAPCTVGEWIIDRNGRTLSLSDNLRALGEHDSRSAPNTTPVLTLKPFINGDPVRCEYYEAILQSGHGEGASRAVRVIERRLSDQTIERTLIEHSNPTDDQDIAARTKHLRTGVPPVAA